MMTMSSVIMENVLRGCSFVMVTLPVKMSLMRRTVHVRPTSSLVSVESASLSICYVTETTIARMDQTREAAVSIKCLTVECTP